ncbi:MAG: 2-C-methyl-D-erythritol 4-phosphate cytidylyltransferase [Clostridia bacterium]|nr:2-C-methyl-D-erythritol 4-phosphate cytidylyltransferase [Clostridia bacterium]
MSRTTAAVLLAAGNSTRMGAPKQFLLIHGCPVLARTMQAFEACSVIDRIVVVAQPTDHERIYALAKEYGISKLQTVIEGGVTRQESAYKGVMACGDAQLVAVHDGARPLITPSVIERVMLAADQYGAASVAVRAKDTMKIADADGLVVSTLDRSVLWNVQTPQAFKPDQYLKVYAHAVDQGVTNSTDECALFEAQGYPVMLVEGEYTNIKMTTPEDILLAEGLLK